MSKRPASPLDPDDCAAAKKATAGKPKCEYGAGCFRKNPQHKLDFDHTPDAPVVDYTVAVSAAAVVPSVLPPAVAGEADSSKPHCAFGKTCYRKNPQHRKDEYHPPPPLPFDPPTFFAGLVIAEQKAAWELAGKAELAKVVGGALGNAMITDLQKIAVSHLEPTHRHTFIWKLKNVSACTARDWEKSPAKNVDDQQHDNPPNEDDADGNDDGDDDDDEQKDDDDDDDFSDDDDKKKKGKGKGKAAAAKGKGKKAAKGAPVASPPPYVSRVGGLPYLPADEDWPTCGQCEGGLPFLFQLLLSDMPEHLGHAYRLPAIPLEKQLFQFFLCVNNNCETFEPYQPTQLIRILDITSYDEDEYKSSRLSKPADLHIYKDRLVIGWTKKTDYPYFEEHEKYKLDLSAFPGDQQDDLCDTWQAIAGEKLSGFPCFVQSAQYWECQTCSKSMRFLFQINGASWEDEEGCPVMLGDSGEGHIMQCAEHREQLAFGWQCG